MMIQKHAIERRTQRSREGGFTLIEVLITMVLLSVALLGLMTLQIATMRNVTGSRRANAAVNLAQSVVERYQSESFANLPPDTDGAWITVLNENMADMVGVGVDGESTGPFTVDLLAEDVGTERLLTVRVSWLDVAPSGRTGSSAKYATKSVTLSFRRYL
jgi:type IV pilus assembly protein PilV